jgi:hypothetical protein
MRDYNLSGKEDDLIRGLIAHIASVVLAEPLRKAQLELQKQGDQKQGDQKQGESRDDTKGKNVGGANTSAVEVSARRPTFILLVDELVACVDELKRFFGGTAPSDVTSAVRVALYDATIMPHLDNTLVMSSLDIDPIGQTYSSRAVHGISLPEELEREEIVEEWFLKTVLDEVEHDAAAKKSVNAWGESNKDKLCVIASTLCTQPRSVELGNNILRELIPPMIQKNVGIDEFFVKNFFDLWGIAMGKRYTISLPEALTLYNVIYAKSIDLDAPTRLNIAKSVYVNSLKEFTGKSKITPKASLLYLCSIAAREKKEDASALNNHPTLALLADLFEGMQLLKRGDVLEHCLALWFCVRLLVLIEKENNGIFTLWEYLGFLLNAPFHKHRSTIGYTYVLEGKFVVTPCTPIPLSTCSYDSTPDFLDMLSLHQVNSNDSLAMFLPATRRNGNPRVKREEAFDFVFAIYDHDKQQDFIFFVEAKSRDIQGEAKCVMTYNTPTL